MVMESSIIPVELFATQAVGNRTPFMDLEFYVISNRIYKLLITVISIAGIVILGQAMKASLLMTRKKASEL